MLAPADMERFVEFLDGENLMVPLRVKMAEARGEDLSPKGSNFQNQMIRVYCQRYDCFDQYEDWVAFFVYVRKMELQRKEAR